MQRVFRKHNIPFHFDNKSEVSSISFVTYILLILKMAEQGITVQAIIRLLKTGLTRISMQDINYIENYIIEFGIKGYNFEREFKKNNKEEQWNLMNYDLKRLNRIRESIVESISIFSESIKKMTNAKALVQTIYNHLLENDVITRYTEEILTVKEETEKIASIRKQTIEKVYDSLDNIVSVLNSENIDLKTFIELFEFSISDLDISTIPMMQDEIVICDINKTRITQKKTIYIIGAYENGLPGNIIEDAILTDNEIEKLKKSGLDIKETSLSRMNMELFNIYFAISKAKENLIITVPASKITGEPLRPSILINEIRIISGKKLEGETVENNTERKFKKLDGVELTNKIAFRNLLENIDISNNITDSELIKMKELYDYYLNNEDNKTYSKILNYVRTDENLKQETLEKLYGDNIKSSVSRLEMFKRCPFSYYTNYILGVKPRVTYKLSIMDMGTLMHDILEGFSKWLLERDIAWQQIINEEPIKEKARKKINEIIENVFEKGYKKHKDTNRYLFLKRKLKNRMFKIVLIIARSFNQSNFKPLGYEIEFKEDGIYAPIEIILDKGKKMHLIGKIDRLDAAVIEDKMYLRIIDYKSSNKSLNLDDIKEGVSLQLMTYMSTIIENKKVVSKDKEVIPAALNYFTLTGNLKKLDEYEQDEVKIKREIMKTLKLKGIYISDLKVIEAMDRNYKDTGKSFIDINSRNISNEDKVIDKEKFEEECKKIKQILKDIGNELTEGNVRISPKKQNGKMPCEYCEYAGVCRKGIRA